MTERVIIENRYLESTSATKLIVESLHTSNAEFNKFVIFNNKKWLNLWFYSFIWKLRVTPWIFERNHLTIIIPCNHNCIISHLTWLWFEWFTRENTQTFSNAPIWKISDCGYNLYRQLSPNNIFGIFTSKISKYRRI